MFFHPNAIVKLKKGAFVIIENKYIRLRITARTNIEICDFSCKIIMKGGTARTETIKEMRERHEREIESLQENCPHPLDQRSDWMEMCWAVAHSSGYFVKECNLCGKVMEKSDPKTTERLHKEGRP